MAIIDSLYNPIEQKQKLKDWEYMLKDNENIFGEIIRSEYARKGALGGAFCAAIFGINIPDYAMALYQTLMDKNIIDSKLKKQSLIQNS